MPHWFSKRVVSRSLAVILSARAPHYSGTQRSLLSTPLDGIIAPGISHSPREESRPCFLFSSGIGTLTGGKWSPKNSTKATMFWPNPTEKHIASTWL